MGSNTLPFNIVVIIWQYVAVLRVSCIEGWVKWVYVRNDMNQHMELKDQESKVIFSGPKGSTIPDHYKEELVTYNGIMNYLH